MPNDYLILGIDPSCKDSAYCFCTADLKPLAFDKVLNKDFINTVNEEMRKHLKDGMTLKVAIEDMENFGSPVGRTTFDTLKFVGRIDYWFELEGIDAQMIFRHEERMTICHSPRANDAIVKQALIDRFAPYTSNYGKGTKKEPGFFYGFRADVWMAFAVAVTYHDKYLCKEETADDLHLEDLPF